MGNKLLQAQGVISKVTTMHDTTLRVTVDTQELSAEDKALLMGFHNKPGWFLFKEAELKEEDVKDLPDIQIEPNEKHPSIRLRAVLYRLWERTDKKQDFEVFYRAKMERIIDWVKTKLN